MTAKQVTKKASAAKPVAAKKAVAPKAPAKPAKAAQAVKSVQNKAVTQKAQEIVVSALKEAGVNVKPVFKKAPAKKVTVKKSAPAVKKPAQPSTSVAPTQPERHHDMHAADLLVDAMLKQDSNAQEVAETAVLETVNAQTLAPLSAPIAQPIQPESQAPSFLKAPFIQPVTLSGAPLVVKPRQ